MMSSFNSHIRVRRGINVENDEQVSMEVLFFFLSSNPIKSNCWLKKTTSDLIDLLFVINNTT